jgi:hypothetical protein
MKNNYGNFVVQKALKLATGSLKVFLIVSVVRCIVNLRDRKLISRWKSIVINNIPNDDDFRINQTDKEILRNCLFFMENNFVLIENFNPYNI